MLAFLKKLLLFIFLLSFTICHCNSECDTVNSMKYGKLILSRSEKPNHNCIGNLVFHSEETGNKFCLNKKRRNVDLAELTCVGCLCGRENKPADWKWTAGKKTSRIVGGEYTGKNQYPWFAMLFMMISTFSDLPLTGGMHICGGSLVTQKVVLSAAHCIKDPKRVPSDYLVGLGIHNISGLYYWTKEEFSKHAIMEVEEIIKHEEWEKSSYRFFDFVLLILKTPARFSQYISPVCLPKKEEMDILERAENIIVGFGTSKIWFIEYNKLLGGKLESASLLTPELFSNKSSLILGFTEGKLEKNIIDGYFKTFSEIFPGIEICLKNYEIVCNITEQLMEIILRNMEEKIRNSGTKTENPDVQDFLADTRTYILPDYAKKINNWKDLTSASKEEKLDIGTWMFGSVLDMETIEKIKRQIKFVNQWYFIAITTTFVTRRLEKSDILKKATGKFVPWSEAKKWNHLDPSIELRKNPSTILVERFEMKTGYSCVGDSGGPLVAMNNGSFVLVASSSETPIIQVIFSWPPPCYCSCKILPETHARVSSALPWIYKSLKDRNLKTPCQR